MERKVAVLDVGMTNKKVAVYDDRLRMVASASRAFPPRAVDGLEAHDLDAMEDWFLDALAGFAREHRIAAVAVATHGATAVCVGRDGKACAPAVLYTHEPGAAFHERFYALAGGREDLQARTGTPDLAALINPAKGLLFLKERYPAGWEAAETILSFPQYWGFRLTGEKGAEGTYVANHSYLWDWEKEDYSSVADALGIRGKLPSPLRRSWEVLGRISPAAAARTGLAADVVVTMGIHDSNASLLPHLAKKPGADFVLNSTGTWCVLMHPQDRYGFEAGELGKVVFFNRSAYLQPVKTAIFLGGKEFEAWSAAIAAAGGSPDAPGPEACAAVLDARDAFILPEAVPGSGQFPGSRARAVQFGPGGRIECPLEELAARIARAARVARAARAARDGAVPPFLKDGKRAMAALEASVVAQTTVALERAGLACGAEVVVEGGFRRNADYLALLAAALPDNRVELTDIPEATALGAAMTAVAALEGTDPVALADRFEVDYARVEPMAGAEGFAAYRGAWMDLIAGLPGPDSGRRNP